MPRRATPSERVGVLAASAALLGAVFALGFAVSDASQAVAVLYTLPIALVAVELGAVAGVVAAALAVALFAAWTALDDIDVSVLGFVTRGIGFLLLGTLLGYFSTSLRAAYEVLRRREQQLQAILDNSTALIHIKDADGRYKLVNRKFEQVFELSQDDVAGRTDHELFPAYMADASRAHDRRVMKECRPLELEETATLDDGAHTYLAVKFPLVDEHGEPYAVCGIATDITKRKLAEEQLRESKDRVRDILDSAHEAFVAMDARGAVTAWNRAAETTFGWPREKVMGRPLAEVLVPERYREAHVRGLEKFMRSGKGAILNKRIELMALHRDGREFPVEMTVTPVRVRGGFAFNAFMHDISERKRREEDTIRLSSLPGYVNGDARTD